MAIKVFKALLSALWTASLVALDTLLVGNPNARSSYRKTILIIRLDAIGDFILWLDAAKELRKLYSSGNFRIVLLGNQLWASLAVFLPYFDDVWAVDRNKFGRNLLYRFGILKKVRDSHFNIVIEPTMSRELLYGDSLVRVSAATHRIGTSGDLSNKSRWWKRLSDRWYTLLLPVNEGNVMELVRNAEFMRMLGLGAFRASIPSLSFLESSLPQELLGKNYYVLFPGAGKAIKRWKVINFAEIARLLYRKTGWLGVVCGGNDDQLLGSHLVETAGVPMQNWCGRTSLHDLIGIIAKSNLLVSNDTGAVHIAAAMSVPIVCIVGGGHYGRFLPYQIETQTSKPCPVPVTHKMECFGCNWKCIYKVDHGQPVPCIENVTTADVWSAIEKILFRGPSDVLAKK